LSLDPKDIGAQGARCWRAAEKSGRSLRANRGRSPSEFERAIVVDLRPLFLTAPRGMTAAGSSYNTPKSIMYTGYETEVIIKSKRMNAQSIAKPLTRTLLENEAPTVAPEAEPRPDSGRTQHSVFHVEPIQQRMRPFLGDRHSPAAAIRRGSRGAWAGFEHLPTPNRAIGPARRPIDQDADGSEAARRKARGGPPRQAVVSAPDGPARPGPHDAHGRARVCLPGPIAEHWPCHLGLGGRGQMGHSHGLMTGRFSTATPEVPGAPRTVASRAAGR
jgi:hypothetical protein